MKFAGCIISITSIGDCILVFANQFNVNVCKRICMATKVFRGKYLFTVDKIKFFFEQFSIEYQSEH